jgi:zinc and cadmium transporter
MAITLSVFCLAIVTVSVLGGLLPLAMVLNHTRLQVYLSFAAGTMLGAAFFHMLPEAVRVGSAATIPWAAFGLLALFFLERFFSFHQHESHDLPAQVSMTDTGGHSQTCVHTESEAGDHAPGTSVHAAVASSMNWAALPWGSTAFGLAVHSLVGGVALASAVAADFDVRDHLGPAGLGVFVATLVHKPADALTITSLMMRAGAGRWFAHLINLAFALMIPAGVVLFSFGVGGMRPGASASWTAGALAFSAGTFLCIALSDLLPELQFHSHDRLKLSVALLAGVVIMAAAAAVEPSERAASAEAPPSRRAPVIH